WVLRHAHFRCVNANSPKQLYRLRVGCGLSNISVKHSSFRKLCFYFQRWVEVGNRILENISDIVRQNMPLLGLGKRRYRRSNDAQFVEGSLSSEWLQASKAQGRYAFPRTTFADDSDDFALVY